MIQLQDIRSCVKEGRYRITEHADEETYNDGLSHNDVTYTLFAGEIIEQYPKDKPYPSCLVFGKNKNAEPIHSVWAYNGDAAAAVLITVYRPDAEKWIDWKIRRKP
jgi:hypothetical protein